MQSVNRRSVLSGAAGLSVAVIFSGGSARIEAFPDRPFASRWAAWPAGSRHGGPTHRRHAAVLKQRLSSTIGRANPPAPPVLYRRHVGDARRGLRQDRRRSCRPALRRRAVVPVFWRGRGSILPTSSRTHGAYHAARLNSCSVSTAVSRTLRSPKKPAPKLRTHATSATTRRHACRRAHNSTTLTTRKASSCAALSAATFRIVSAAHWRRRTSYGSARASRPVSARAFRPASVSLMRTTSTVLPPPALAV